MTPEKQIDGLQRGDGYFDETHPFSTGEHEMLPRRVTRQEAVKLVGKDTVNKAQEMAGVNWEEIQILETGAKLVVKKQNSLVEFGIQSGNPNNSDVALILRGLRVKD